MGFRDDFEIRDQFFVQRHFNTYIFPNQTYFTEQRWTQLTFSNFCDFPFNIEFGQIWLLFYIKCENWLINSSIKKIYSYHSNLFVGPNLEKGTSIFSFKKKKSDQSIYFWRRYDFLKTEYRFVLILYRTCIHCTLASVRLRL